MAVSGWIGVDLDGTLALYKGEVKSIGDPIPLMAERVRAWLDQGVDVRIVTARVASHPYDSELNKVFIAEQTQLIQDWTEKHFGVRLPVTASKDFAMIELWDDRAVRVEMNTGRILCSYEESS
jgi:hydroxymethylpyrimidine pyrophosphatase-like HAD family hydrolase